MDARQIAKEFVISYFDVRENFFDTAWDFVNVNFDRISSVATSAKGMDTIGGPLAFGGREEQGAVKAILIFADGFREMPLKSDFSDLVDSVREACSKYKAEARLTDEILKKVTSLENRIAKFMKPELASRAVEREKEEKAEYEVFLSGKKKVFVSSEKAEVIRNKKGTTRGIFIDDERKEVFFRGNIINEFQGQMYSMLRHFVENEGVGGEKTRVYECVWEDSSGSASDENIDGAVDIAMKRFRDLLKKYKMGNIVIRSEGVFGSRKIYVLEPKHSYHILKRIE